MHARVRERRQSKREKIYLCAYYIVVNVCLDIIANQSTLNTFDTAKFIRNRKHLFGQEMSLHTIILMFQTRRIKMTLSIYAVFLENSIPFEIMCIMGVMGVLIPIKLILILPFHKIYVPVNCEMKRTIYDKFTKHTKLLIFIGYTDFHEILLIFFFLHQ